MTSLALQIVALTEYYEMVERLLPGYCIVIALMGGAMGMFKTEQRPRSRPYDRATIFGGLLVLAMTLLNGCAYSRGTLGDEVKDEDVAAIKKGETTRTQVVARLGAPDRIAQANGQDVFQYYRYDVKGGSLLLILVNFSRLNIKSDDLYVFFNQKGVVDDVVFGKRTKQLKFQFWPFGD
jgi:outer membrane protein assembly factor BamE (lipoprotein component of BamABCDE complex)